MPSRSLVKVLVALLVPVALAAQAVPDATVARGKLSFDAKATVGDFTGVTTAVTGKLIGAPSLSGVRGWVEAPARSLSTDNGRRDSDMGNSLQIDKFTTIRFDLDSVAPGTSQGDSTAVTLKGRFTLHGQTRAESVPGWVWLSAGGIRFRGALPINVKDYGVGGLTHFLVLKMNEVIFVRMDVMFDRT